VHLVPSLPLYEFHFRPDPTLWDALVQEYDLGPEEAIRDCEQFLQELVQEGILIWRQNPKG